MNNLSGSVIVSWDLSHGRDIGVLCGEQTNGHVTIINVYQGKEADDIYKKLTTPNEKFVGKE